MREFSRSMSFENSETLTFSDHDPIVPECGRVVLRVTWTISTKMAPFKDISTCREDFGISNILLKKNVILCPSLIRLVNIEKEIVFTLIPRYICLTHP